MRDRLAQNADDLRMVEDDAIRFFKYLCIYFQGFTTINSNETHKAHGLPRKLTKPKLATKLILSQVSEKGKAFRLYSSLGESKALTIVADTKATRMGNCEVLTQRKKLHLQV